MVLLDSVFHFYKNDKDKETGFLKWIIEEIEPGGLICNFMQKGSKSEKLLKSTIQESGESFEILLDGYLDGYTDYPEYDAKFHMYVIKKI